MPQAETPKGNRPPSREARVPHAEVPNEHPSKKKKCNHRELSRHEEVPREIPRAEEPPSGKGKEAESTPDAFHPRREDDYSKMLQHLRHQFVKADYDTIVIGLDIVGDGDDGAS